MIWWKQGVVYQIYPRSFQDSNRDGIGDLQGIISRLDYLNDGTPASLGIDAIWLSPFFPSPMADFGYDISDYCDIDPAFGTLTDFDRLLVEAHRRQIRIILDLVVNHTSDQHPWFIDSATPGSDKADWYIWHSGPERPNNWQSCFGGHGWSWHPKRQAWYFHSFLPQQPDLNWRNPHVVEAIRGIIDFWLARGADGFRLDVVNLYFKDELLRNNRTHWLRVARPYDRQQHLWDRNRPELHEALRNMRQWVDAWPDRMLIGEVFLQPDDDATLPASYCGNGDELHMAFNFEFLRCRFTANAFRDVLQRWIDNLGETNWPNYTLSNHDVPRHTYRFRNGALTHDRLRLLALMMLTLRGTPFLYYGEEIGMPEQRVPRQHLQDPVGIQYWPLHPGRDGCRRPMMWNKNPQAFSSSHSWLPNEPVSGHTVEDQLQDPNSLLSWYRQLIWLRKELPALNAGELVLLGSHDDILAYERRRADSRLLIALNFSTHPRYLQLPPQAIKTVLANSQHGHPLFDTHGLQLRPLQALIMEIAANFPQRNRI